MSNKEDFSYLKNCQNGSYTKPKKETKGHKLRNQRRIHHHVRSQQKWLFCPQLSWTEAGGWWEVTERFLVTTVIMADDNQFHG